MIKSCRLGWTREDSGRSRLLAADGKAKLRIAKFVVDNELATGAKERSRLSVGKSTAAKLGFAELIVDDELATRTEEGSGLLALRRDAHVGVGARGLRRACGARLKLQSTRLGGRGPQAGTASRVAGR
jgi:hypothetical protein